MAETAIMCVGHVNYDVVLHTTSVPDPDFSSPITGEQAGCGGAVTNTAMVLSSFGRDVSVAGSVGDDEYGELMRDGLREAGIESLLVDGGVPTTVVYAIITDDADPRYLAKNEENGAFTFADIDRDAWAETTHVHIESFDADTAGEVAREAAADGKTVSFNPSQGYEREDFTSVVENADVIFLNEREANIFRSRHDFETVVENAIVVMTHGAAGSTAYTPHGVVTHSGYESGEIADTIGAGDSFVSGFLEEWLSEDDYPDIKQSLALANACGARAVTQVGAPDGLDADSVRGLVEDG